MTEETHPSEVDQHVSFFDRFAGTASEFVSRAPFFVFCASLVVLWLPTLLLLNLNTSQLIINTITTIVTFLMVALLQNSQTRFEAATSKKLNAIADALADFLEWEAERSRSKKSCETLMGDAQELRAGVGLELREST